MEVVELYHIVPISFATVLTVHALTRPVLPHHGIAKNPKHCGNPHYNADLELP